MAFIQFFEKPSRINGENQKRILIEAGNVLECVNILNAEVDGIRFNPVKMQNGN